MAIIAKSVVTQAEVVDDILCNKCGVSLKRGDDPKLGFRGMVEVIVEGAVGSPKLVPGNEYAFSLCEHCLVELWETFKLPVEMAQAEGSVDWAPTDMPQA